MANKALFAKLCDLYNLIQKTHLNISSINEVSRLAIYISYTLIIIFDPIYKSSIILSCKSNFN